MGFFLHLCPILQLACPETAKDIWRGILENGKLHQWTNKLCVQPKSNLILKIWILKSSGHVKMHWHWKGRWEVNLQRDTTYFLKVCCSDFYVSGIMAMNSSFFSWIVLLKSNPSQMTVTFTEKRLLFYGTNIFFPK